MASESTEPVRFRPSKKRKAFRQRTETGDSEHESQPRAVAAYYSDQEDVAGPAVVKARSAHRGRLRGVGFRTGSKTDSSDGPEQQALTVRAQQDGATVPVTGLSGRFTHQTGLISDFNDKHMNEYIESRLSSRAAQRSAPQHVRDDDTSPTDQTQDGSVAKSPGQSIMQGKLMEVDLQTEVEKRSRSEEAPERQPQMQDREPKRQRLGPDGKPWRSRKRRGSDDIKRDQLVEEFLHENRLDVYDVPDPQATAADADGDGDGDADERLAEQFRRQFMEDVAQRRLKKKKPAQQPGKPGAEEVLKGPKLGGSRNARAAVRDMLLKKEKEGKR